MTTVTQWFYGVEKPVRPGVYECDHSFADNNVDKALGVKFRYWDGFYWRLFGDSHSEAKREIVASSHQNLPWRGIAK